MVNVIVVDSSVVNALGHTVETDSHYSRNGIVNVKGDSISSSEIRCLRSRRAYYLLVRESGAYVVVINRYVLCGRCFYIKTERGLSVYALRGEIFYLVILGEITVES